MHFVVTPVFVTEAHLPLATFLTVVQPQTAPFAVWRFFQSIASFPCAWTILSIEILLSLSNFPVYQFLDQDPQVLSERSADRDLLLLLQEFRQHPASWGDKEVEGSTGRTPEVISRPSCIAL